MKVAIALFVSLLMPSGNLHAATIALDTWSQEIYFGEPVGTPCEQFTASSEVATGATIDAGCSGSFSESSRFFTSTSNTDARGSFGSDGLVLGAVADVTVTNYFSTITAWEALASSTATFYDTVTVSGGPSGSSGFLEFGFDVEGTVSEFAHAQLSANGVSSTALPDGTTHVSLAVPVIFGSPTLLSIVLNTSAEGRLPDPGSTPTEFEAVANFFSTAMLRQVSVLDSAGNVLVDGSVLSSSGLDYPDVVPADAVPEPASLLLVGTGLVGSCIRRRIANRQQR